MKNNIAYLVYAQAAELFSVLVRLSTPSGRIALREISVRRGLGPGLGLADREKAMGSEEPPSIFTEYGLKGGTGRFLVVLAPLVDTYRLSGIEYAISRVTLIPAYLGGTPELTSESNESMAPRSRS